MVISSRSLPDGVTLSSFSQKVFDVLGNFTSFPWPVLAAQCKRAGVDPTNVTASSLKLVIPYLASGVARFTSPEKKEEVQEALLQLCKDFGF